MITEVHVSGIFKAIKLIRKGKKHLDSCTCAEPLPLKERTCSSVNSGIFAHVCTNVCKIPEFTELHLCYFKGKDSNVAFLLTLRCSFFLAVDMVFRCLAYVKI